MTADLDMGGNTPVNLNVASNITTNAPITGGGAALAGLTIAIPVATAAVDGYLAAVDWTRFDDAVTKIGAGITCVIVTAALTPLGAQGSQTFTNGILTAQVQAT